MSAQPAGILLFLAVSGVVLAGCGRHAAPKTPDPSRGRFERVAPEVAIRPAADGGARSAAALLQLAQNRLQTGELK
ncbi:MAG TPA: hypothetical protein VIG68_07220, partial [Lysobacter sp.]